jgi:hypothetical protein
VGKYDYTGVEQNTRAFLENLQQNPGPLFTSYHQRKPGMYYQAYSLVMLQNFTLI